MLPGRGREDPGARAPGPLLRRLEPPQPVNQDRVVRDGIRGIQDPSEQLVIARGRQRELGAQRLLFRPRVPVPPRLEVEDSAVAIGEGHSPTVRRARSVAAEHRGGSSG